MNKKVKDEIKKELEDLIDFAEMVETEFSKDGSLDLRDIYQSWFTRACRVVELILPQRYEEFKEYYYFKNNENSKFILLNNYRIQAFFNNLAISHTEKSNSLVQAQVLFLQQLSILKSCDTMLESKLDNIENEMLIELNETELDTAKSLLKINLRASGCITGVVLEKHLKSLLNKYCPNHGKKDSELTLNVINELLKEKAYDTKTFKNIQYLSDIRNLCDHDKKDSEGKTKEPTKEDVETLIENTERIMKTIY